jgi:cell division protein FtsB
MSNVLRQYRANKHHLFLMLGILLCAYFLYHSFHGQRSYPNLLAVNSSIEKLERDYAVIKTEREALEKQVVMLRPGSVNPDLLEERARLVLGYKNPDELIILGE